MGIEQETMSPETPRHAHDKSLSGGHVAEVDEQIAKLIHDIRGPLTTILINCELVLEQDCSADIRAKTESTLAAAMRINQNLREFEND